MGWGAMMGLGQSLQQVGGMVLDYNKDKMQAKLEQEREARAEQRQKDKEQREQAQYGQTKFEKDGDGLWWQVDYTKGNQPMDRKLASKDKIDEFNRTERLGKIEEEILGYDSTLKGAQAGVAKELAGLTLDEKRASIDSKRALAAQRRTGGASGGSSSAKVASDARSAGLDSSTLEALFPARDSNGKISTDDNGKPLVDYAKLEEYMMSPEYQQAKDKTAGAARFLARRTPEVQGERSERGRAAGLEGEVLDRYIKTGSSGLKKEEDLDERGKEELASIRESERAAIQAIDSGKISVEAAAQRMADQGWTHAAARLRARYGK